MRDIGLVGLGSVALDRCGWRWMKLLVIHFFMRRDMSLPSLACHTIFLLLLSAFSILLLQLFVQEMVAPPSKHQIQELNITPDDSTALTAPPTALLLVLGSHHASAGGLSRSILKLCSPRLSLQIIEDSIVTNLLWLLCIPVSSDSARGITVSYWLIHRENQISPCQPSFHLWNDPRPGTSVY